MAEERKSARPENPNSDWQDKDIKIRGLVIALVIILVTTISTMIAMKSLQEKYGEEIRAADNPISPLAGERTIPQNTPLLQIRPRDELAAHRAAEDVLLNHYQWVDQDLGIARIPVDRAMRILVEKGFPVREGQQSMAHVDP